MKLLKKSQVAEKLNQQKKFQIDEGVLIAQKVYALRTSLVDLEIQYKNFSKNKEGELKKQLGGLENDILALKAEIVLLENQRQGLRKPLDTEWANLKEEKEKFKNEQKEFDKKAYNLQVASIEVKNKEIDFESQMKIFITRVKETESNNERSKSNLKRTSEKLKLAQEEKERVEDHVLRKTSELTSREANLAAREREQDIKETHIQYEQYKINKQRILLEDREATLEREIKRQNK